LTSLISMQLESLLNLASELGRKSAQNVLKHALVLLRLLEHLSQAIDLLLFLVVLLLLLMQLRFEICALLMRRVKLCSKLLDALVSLRNVSFQRLNALESFLKTTFDDALFMLNRTNLFSALNELCFELLTSLF
jgi:hypothetical protein